MGNKETLDFLILEEENSEICPNDVMKYAAEIGIDVDVYPDFLHICKQSLQQKLPPYWKACWDQQFKKIFYYNFITHQSTWKHPLEHLLIKTFQIFSQKHKTQNIRPLKISNNKVENVQCKINVNENSLNCIKCCHMQTQLQNLEKEKQSWQQKYYKLKKKLINVRDTLLHGQSVSALPVNTLSTNCLAELHLHSSTSDSSSPNAARNELEKLQSKTVLLNNQTRFLTTNNKVHNPNLEMSISCCQSPYEESCTSGICSTWGQCPCIFTGSQSQSRPTEPSVAERIREHRQWLQTVRRQTGLMTTYPPVSQIYTPEQQ